MELRWLSGKGTEVERKVRLSQDMCGFSLQAPSGKLGEETNVWLPSDWIPIEQNVLYTNAGKQLS